MNALLRALDVDPMQWRALVRALLRVDFGALRGVHGQTAAKESAAGIRLALFVYLLSGATPAIMVGATRDVYFGATITVTMVGFMVLSTLLVGEGSTIVSPSDHHVLGFRPVTSRTYLAVRITSLLLRTAVIAGCVTLAPAIVFLLKDGTHPGLALAVLAAAFATALAVTLTVVAMYGWLLRVAGPRRLMRYASYVQLSAQMITWFGLVVATQDFARRALGGVALADMPWALLYPGAWFGSYVALASGQVSWVTLVPAGLSMLLLAVLVRAIGGKLSLDYSESLSRVASAAAPQVPGAESAQRWLHLLNHETRAIAILVRSQLRHDMKFRMALISLLPITLVYMYMGGWPADPFVPRPDGLRESGQPGMIQMVLLFLPQTLRRAMITSDAYRASWIFHATPANRAELVLAARNIITLAFLVPYLACLAVLFGFAFRDPLHAVLHAAFIGLLSFLVLQFTIMVSPRLPFALPLDKEANSGRMFALLIGTTIVGLIMYWVLTAVVYKSAIAMVATAVAFVVASWWMDRVTRGRVARVTTDAGYAG